MNAATIIKHIEGVSTADMTKSEPSARVLVVDDVADNRDVLTRRLVRRGFEVGEADGGRAALTALATKNYDIVLLDIMMPDILGSEVLRVIRETRSQTDLPVIMVSAKSESEDVVQALEMGANDYVTKPVDFSVALARINTQLMRRRAAADADRQSRELRIEMESQRDDLTEAETQLAHESEQRRQADERLRFLAYHDPLTGLFNRAAFRETLATIVDLPVPEDHALIFFDLDCFKSINDERGHETGDKLLEIVSRRLRKSCGSGVVLGRLGGDEFAGIVDERVQGSAQDIALKVIDSIRQPFRIGDQTFEIGISCGIARPKDDLRGVDELINAADLAMYCAKTNGRGRVVEFEAQMLAAQRDKRVLEIDLRNAIRDAAFELHYQPLISTTTGDLMSFEALLRWNHPTRGLIEPEVFIPLAEETGLIVSLGEWALRRVCLEAATWPSHLKVAVNLSPVQFRHRNLLNVLVTALGASGLEPSRLELEITESALTRERDRTMERLRAIRELGIRITMDDFGVSYASMSYLQDFKFDRIKIDRSFIGKISEERAGHSIVKTLLELGERIGIVTTAEGVETAEQFNYVASAGCGEAQGFFLSKPLSAECVREFMLKSDAGSTTKVDIHSASNPS